MVPRPSHRRDAVRTTAAEENDSIGNNNRNIVVEAYHRDMLRVLESRRTEETSIPLRRGRRSSQPSSSSSSYSSFSDSSKVMVAGTKKENANSIRSSSNNNSRAADPDGAERCRCLLQHLQHTLQAANETSFQIVMYAFLQRGRTRWRDDARWVCAADQLEQLLHELQEYLQQQQPPNELPKGDPSSIATPRISITTYNYVLQAYAQCATPYTNYATRAQQLLLQARVTTLPNLESYLHVVHALAWQQANRKPAREAVQALDVLQQHILVYNNNHNNINDDDDDDDNSATAAVQMRAYAYVMEAFSKSLNGASQCLELLQRMKQLNATFPNNANVSQYLDPEVYSNAILAWSKQEVNNNATTSGKNSSAAHHAEQVHALLLEVLDHAQQNAFGPAAVPPLIAFNSVISAWGRAQRPDRVEWVLQRLQQERQRHPHALQPDAVLYNSILHSFLSAPLAPNVALDKSLQLLQYMHDESRSGRQPAIAPDSYSYYTLLKCWIQTGNHKQNKKNRTRQQQQQPKSRDDSDHRPQAAEQAEALLHQMEECWKVGDTSMPPSRLIYNMVMNAYAKSQHSQAAPRAWRLLRRMQDSKWSDCHPDIISFTSCLECLAQPHCSLPNPAGLAAQLLHEAGERYRVLAHAQPEREDLEQYRPNLRTYTMAIQTLANHGGSAQQARDWLTQLCDEYQRTKLPSLQPNTYPYNYVLNCAANTVGEDGSSERQLEAFQIATQTFQEMRHSSETNNHSAIEPDSFSYAFWLKCCHKLLSPGSDFQRQCAQLAWKECQNRELVTEHVLQRYRQIMGDWNDDDNRKESKPSAKRTKPEAPPTKWAWSRQAAESLLPLRNGNNTTTALHANR